ncbi:hypothetical protein GQ54DRAFT_318200 [Martensiomyces pterosporus]|nr:hypothetical protein GQ54DRAFT_318200 [Martensiomyces pterosporus]
MTALFARRLCFKAYLAAAAAKSAIKYYLKGPRCPKWSLAYQVRRDISYSALAYVFSDCLAEEDINKLDIQQIADSCKKFDLEEAVLPQEIGIYCSSSIPVAAVEIDTKLFAGAGVAEPGLVSLTEADRTAAGRLREIPYEVVVSNSALESLREHGAAQEQAFLCAPLCPDERIILYLHGGAYTMGSPASHRLLVGHISDSASRRAFVVDYRLAPLHPFPAQLHDAYISFCYLVSQGFKPENIVVAGDSAGGNLALALSLLLRHVGARNIQGLVLLSPWTDLMQERPSLKKNADYDWMYAVELTFPEAAARLFYAPGRKYSGELLAEMSHPLLSPVNGDFKGFPPTLTQAGEKEILVDDIAQLHKNIVAANPDQHDSYIYECYEDMAHVFHQLFGIQDSQLAIASIGKFMKNL